MRLRLTLNITAMLFLYGLSSTALNAQTQSGEESDTNRIGVVERLGERLPKDIPLTDEEGTMVTTGELFSTGKPLVLVLHYSNCPMLCSLILTGLGKAVQQTQLVPGRDYYLAAISIDPNETVEKALAGAQRYRAYLSSDSPPKSWRFFIASEASINALADALGFKYFPIPDTREFAHPAVIFILTPDGIISRYLYGLEFKPNDFRLAILEAGQGRVGGVVERIILSCYRWDAQSGGYVLWAGRIMRIGGGLTGFALILLLWFLWRGEKKEKGNAHLSSPQYTSVKEQRC